ncbi:hypothetical protein SXCC_00540 [Gluconacetobacter sp. SXCC-1]|nr:hypothetical protein SXCC_00540 [Gluconacetobacter sp. SXCC-1]
MKISALPGSVLSENQHPGDSVKDSAPPCSSQTAMQSVLLFKT